jgi:hypothetical protein
MAVSELRSRCQGFWRRRLLRLRDRIDRRVEYVEEHIEKLAAARQASAAEGERPRPRRRAARRTRRSRLTVEG